MIRASTTPPTIRDARGHERAGAARNRARILAAAMVELLDKHVHLVLGSEIGHSRLETGAYGFWRAHVRALAVDAAWPEPDGVVDMLLAPLVPEVFLHQRDELALDIRQIRSTSGRLAARV